MPKSKSTAASESATLETSLDTASPKLNPQDFVEALLDPRVIDALTKALTPLRSSIEAALGKKIDSLGATLRALKDDNVRLSDQCKTLTAENGQLKQQLTVCNQRVDDLERYSRSDNLIIRGLPETTAAEVASAAPSLHDGATLRESHASVEKSVIALCKDTLKIDVLPSDISTAHRIKAGAKDSVRPVIVRFTNRKVRNLVFGAKKLLKGASSRIYISEHLTKVDTDLFFEERRLLREGKIFGAWTMNGVVHVRFSPDPTTKATTVRSHADLALRQ